MADSMKGLQENLPGEQKLMEKPAPLIYQTPSEMKGKPAVPSPTFLVMEEGQLPVPPLPLPGEFVNQDQQPGSLPPSPPMPMEEQLFGGDSKEGIENGKPLLP